MEKITIDEFITMREENKKNYFFNLCSLPENKFEIKKLLLSAKSKELFDQELLRAGLLGAVTNKQEKHIGTIMSFVEKNNIIFNQHNINSLFICSFAYKNEQLINYFYEKYNSIQLDKNRQNSIIGFQSTILTEGTIIIKNKFSSGTTLGIYNIDTIRSDYTIINLKFRGNPLYFALENLNNELFDFIVNKKDFIINENLTEQLMINLISGNSRESLVMLLSNVRIREAIVKSDTLNLFLNQTSQFYEMKKEVKSMINMLTLENSIEHKDDINTKKLKL